jgi:hypothetical protein
LNLELILGVENVRVAGEEVWCGSGLLVSGVAYISCCGVGGVFILSDTGFEIGFDGEGISEAWRLFSWLC